jgi:hypothetical protein
MSGIAVAFASGLLVFMVERVPTLAQNFLAVGWGILAVVLFGVSLLTRQKFYRFAGFAVFLLVIVRLLYDARVLTGVYKPLAFIGVAILMFAVSFGYFYASRLLDSRAPAPAPPSLPEEKDEAKEA